MNGGILDTGLFCVPVIDIILTAVTGQGGSEKMSRKN